MDYAEEQNNEVQALEYIYSGEGELEGLIFCLNITYFYSNNYYLTYIWTNLEETEETYCHKLWKVVFNYNRILYFVL